MTIEITDQETSTAATAESADGKIRAQIQASDPTMGAADVARNVAKIRGQLSPGRIANPSLLTNAEIAPLIEKALLKTDAESLATLGTVAARESDHGAGPATKILNDVTGRNPLRGEGQDDRKERRTLSDLRIATGDYSQIQNVTAKNFAGSAFDQAGMNFATLHYLRDQDRNFTAQNILEGATQTKALGFDPNNKVIMKAEATISHYDNNKKATFEAQRKFNQGLKDDEELDAWKKELNDPSTSEEKKEELRTKMGTQIDHHAETSRMNARSNDPNNHPNARAANEIVKRETIGKFIGQDAELRARYGLEGARRTKNTEHTMHIRAQTSEKPLGKTQGDIDARDKGKSQSAAITSTDAIFGAASPNPPKSSAAPVQPERKIVAQAVASPSVN